MKLSSIDLTLEYSWHLRPEGGRETLEFDAGELGNAVRQMRETARRLEEEIEALLAHKSLNDRDPAYRFDAGLAATSVVGTLEYYGRHFLSDAYVLRERVFSLALSLLGQDASTREDQEDFRQARGSVYEALQNRLPDIAAALLPIEKKVRNMIRLRNVATHEASPYLAVTINLTEVDLPYFLDSIDQPKRTEVLTVLGWQARRLVATRIALCDEFERHLATIDKALESLLA